MSKVTVVTDSIACLSQEQVEKLDIHVVPIKILFEGNIYRDGVDLSTSEAYKLLEKSPDLFSTAPSSPVDYIDIFSQILLKRCDILCITVSSKLSTTYNVARIAAEKLKEEHHDIKIEVMDSTTATAAQGFIAMSAAKEAATGKDLTEVSKAAIEIREQVKILFLLDTIQHAYRTGRVPKIASQVGSKLGVKPIITISDGLVHFISAVRNKSHGIDRIIEIMKQKVGDKRIHVAVMHTDVLDEAIALKDRIAKEFNCVELFITEVSPIIGYSIGRGTLALAYY